MVQDSVLETVLNQEIFFISVLFTRMCNEKNVVDMNQVRSRVVKLVNSLRTRGFNHGQFAPLLQDFDTTLIFDGECGT
jgi:hypothetical protein